MTNEEIGQRRVKHARGVEVLTGYGGANDGEDARANDRADAQRRERPWPEGLLQAMFGRVRIPDELVD
ncbi:MAG TPA: hypothetical protein VHX20_09095 [Terracidiphilus sp.]|jgi:hypothetical protein|nr:hypothetical protein [Terracidiphilus sp.]